MPIKHPRIRPLSLLYTGTLKGTIPTLLAIALMLALLAGFSSQVGAAPLEQQIPTATPAAAARFFGVKVTQTPVAATVTPAAGQFVQDIEGSVLDRSGKGVDGISVRVAWGNAQVLTTTRDGGKFRFTLASGEYRVRLTGVSSDEAALNIGSQTRSTIEFREIDRASPVAPASPAATATRTVTATPTSTPTPVPSATPTASGQPAPGIGTPVSISVVSVRQPTPTVVTAVRALDFPFPVPSADVDLEGLGRTFVAGVGIGAILAALGLVVVAVRRF